MPCKGSQAVLEGETIKCFRICDRGQDLGCPPVLQVGEDLLPDFYDEVRPTAAPHTPILVKFCSDLMHSPIQYIRLHDFAY